MLNFFKNFYDILTSHFPITCENCNKRTIFERVMADSVESFGALSDTISFLIVDHNIQNKQNFDSTTRKIVIPEKKT